MTTSFRDLLRVVPDQRPGLASLDCAATPGAPSGGKQAGIAALAEDALELAALQDRLWAQSTAGVPQRLLLVLQGMDTSGKDGTVRHVIGAMNPGGCRVVPFGRPTDEELAHDFLWRATKALPHPGEVGVFTRSHYEDVLIVRVHNLVPQAEWETRYDRINAWEGEEIAAGTTIVKVCLAISLDEQRDRLLARLDDPTKRWKANPDDVTERGFWPDYMTAYDDAVARCSTAEAPWYVVPADRKWYRNLAVARLLIETLREMDPRYPSPDLDLAGMRAALAEPSRVSKHTQQGRALT